jgi:uncharacterized Zn finger protein (UPF0148 family)
VCPDCGTEVFSFGGKLKCPTRGSRAFKRFLQEPSIKGKIDTYNANPVKDWKTIIAEKKAAKRKAKEEQEARLVARKRRAEEIANPKVEVCEIVAIKDNITTMPHNRLNQSVWFLVRVNGKLYVYNTTSLRECMISEPETSSPFDFFPSAPAPVNPYGIPVGGKRRLSEILKRRLNSTIRKFLECLKDTE